MMMRSCLLLAVILPLIFASAEPEPASKEEDEWKEYFSSASGEVVKSGAFLTLEEVKALEVSGKLHFLTNVEVVGQHPDTREVVGRVFIQNYSEEKIILPINTLLEEDDYEIINLASGEKMAPGNNHRGFYSPWTPPPPRGLVVHAGEVEWVSLPIRMWNHSVFSSTGHRYEAGKYELRQKHFPTLRLRFTISRDGELTIHNYLNPLLDRADALKR